VVIDLDGSEGEGGGQILRSALSLSAITGAPFQLFKIRANRRRPGLRRQHLTCVLAVAELTGAEVEGAEIGSRKLVFTPRRAAVAGDYHFDIGTAGSTTLLLQAALWPLAHAGAVSGDRSTVTVTGGTHNPMAPPFEFLAQTFAPAIRRGGVELIVELERAGFYPKGGGRIRAAIAAEKPSPIALAERGEPGGRRAVVVLANLAEHIARREIAVLAEQLDVAAAEVQRPKCRGAGNLVHVILPHAEITEVVTGFGERGRPAEHVAATAAAEALAYLESDAPVGEHLADQLVIPLALGGGEVRCTAPSLHTRTNIAVVSRFLPGAGLSLEDAGDGSWWLRAVGG
jgi:RNA 3'-terminal phosphate cyclase (ATP)